MHAPAASRRAVVASALYGLLDPIPYGCFAAALVFDILYLRTAVMLWDKAAAWLIVFGLLAAIVPRLVHLARVWITRGARSVPAERIAFWLHLLAIVAAIFNAFVHSRDAYAVVPAGVWLSVCTVVLMAAAHVLVAVRRDAAWEPAP
jgi:uncharacterized membrane protein